MPTTISADGTTIAYDVHGSGPTLILVGGATQYRAIDAGTARMAAALADRHTIVHYDRRGRGRSGNTAPYAVAREIEDISALITASGAPAALYGMSSGAILAIEAAAALPDGITAVIGYEPPVDPDKPAALTWSEVAAQEALSAAGDGEGALLAFLGDMMPPEALTGFRQSPGFPAFAAVGHTIAYDFRIIAEASAGGFPERWQAATMPILIIDGDQSFGFMRAGADAVAAALPNARRLTLAGQSHDVDIAVLVPVIRDFLAN
jgi:pimeloyl-ACP methyl ester carboxylesterase